jgi:hypothetical protein
MSSGADWPDSPSADAAGERDDGSGPILSRSGLNSDCQAIMVPFIISPKPAEVDAAMCRLRGGACWSVMLSPTVE